jgi:hypothetical protein
MHSLCLCCLVHYIRWIFGSLLGAVVLYLGGPHCGIGDDPNSKLESQGRAAHILTEKLGTVCHEMVIPLSHSSPSEIPLINQWAFVLHLALIYCNNLYDRIDALTEITLHTDSQSLFWRDSEDQVHWGIYRAGFVFGRRIRKCKISYEGIKMGRFIGITDKGRRSE